MVFLTDGQGNIALDGAADRVQAQADTERAARAFAFAGLAGLVLDTQGGAPNLGPGRWRSTSGPPMRRYRDRVPRPLLSW